MKNKTTNLNIDERFWQLLELAGEGDEGAQAELWQVYGFNYGIDKAPVTNDRLIQAVFKADDEAKSRAWAILSGEEQTPPSKPENIEGPLLLGMGDSAKLMGLSRATLWRMIRDGRLEKVEIYHNAFRLRRSDILALVNSKESCHG